MFLKGLVNSPDSTVNSSDGSGVSAQGEGDATQPQALGRAVAADLLAQGAGRFLG